MQLDEETAEYIRWNFAMCSTGKYLKINPNTSKSISLLHDNRITSSAQVPTCHPTQLYRGLSLGGKQLEVVADRSTVSSAEVKKSGAISQRHIYLSIMCTGTAVTFCVCCNVMYMVTGNHLQLYWITIPTHCIYSHNGDRSECNRWIAFPGLWLAIWR
jgi:hypothetical protein